MVRKSFDNLAPWYSFLEAITFGSFLQKCRVALLPQVLDARQVLILGEGDGRFLEAFARENSHGTVDCLDKSPALLARAENRLQKIPTATGRIHFLQGDAQLHPFPTGKYDLVICNFFLDCFTAREITKILGTIKGALQPKGRILIGDFKRPGGMLFSIIANPLLAIMHLFFRITTGISATRLENLDPFLHENGFLPLEKKDLLFGFLQSSLWIEGDSGGRQIPG